jgi:hypothetical protein
MIKTPTWSTRGRYGRKRHYTTILLKFIIVGFLIIISSVMASTLSSIKTTTPSSLSSSKRTASSNQKRSRTHAKISPQQSCTGHAVVPSNRRACGLFLWDLVGKRMNIYIYYECSIWSRVCAIPNKQTTKQNKVILSLFSIFNDGTKIQIQRQITALRGPVQVVSPSTKRSYL